MSGSDGGPIAVKIAGERLRVRQIDWGSANQVYHFVGWWGHPPSISQDWGRVDLKG